MIRAFLFQRFYLKNEFNGFIITVGKKVLLITIIAIFGYVTLWIAGAFVSNEYILFLQLGTMAAVLILSIFVIILALKYLSKYVNVLTECYTNGRRALVSESYRNGFYLLIVMLIAIVMVVIATRFIRGIFISYLQLTAANLIAFSVIVLLLAAVILFFYRKIKHTMERLEKTNGAI